MPTNIKSAEYTSVWDDCFPITTKCLVNTDTKEVFNIKTARDTPESIDILTREYITLDGVEYPVIPNDDITGNNYTGFWYKR